MPITTTKYLTIRCDSTDTGNLLVPACPMQSPGVWEDAADTLPKLALGAGWTNPTAKTWACPACSARTKAAGK